MFKWIIYKVRWMLFGNRCSKCAYNDLCIFSDGYKRAQTYGSIKCAMYQNKK